MAREEGDGPRVTAHAPHLGDVGEDALLRAETRGVADGEGRPKVGKGEAEGAEDVTGDERNRRRLRAAELVEANELVPRRGCKDSDLRGHGRGAGGGVRHRQSAWIRDAGAYVMPRHHPLGDWALVNVHADVGVQPRQVAPGGGSA